MSRRRPDGAKHRHASWRLHSTLEEASPLDHHVSELLDYIDAHHDGFEAIRKECNIDVFCGIFSGPDQGGFTFEPELSRRLADAGLAVGFDIYSDV